MAVRWLFEPMLAAAGFNIAAADFDGKVYGAYTCIKGGVTAGVGDPGRPLG